jgi:hypothetical protein
VPFALRRGVQLLAAFIAGLLVFWGGVWLTNGLRDQRQTERSRTEELRRRQAGAAWNDFVRSEVGTIGTVQEGRPPEILPDVRAAIEALGGKRPPDAVADLEDAADEAERVSKTVSEFDLSGTIRDKGFNEAGVLRFVSARDELVTAIDLYREVALLGVVAARLEGDERKAVLDRAESVLTKADTAATRFYLHHTEAMAAAGIIQQPTLPGS